MKKSFDLFLLYLDNKYFSFLEVLYERSCTYVIYVYMSYASLIQLIIDVYVESVLQYFGGIVFVKTQKQPPEVFYGKRCS